ncbi:MAG: addiction module toxin RelE [Oscillospiraceae bacterium]|nr:addiction module toxin RelE [Oscillospiraceae bacterium]
MVIKMKIKLKKQPEKYLSKCSKSDCDKIHKALLKLESWQGDIKLLEGYKATYRLKIPPFRIIFTYVKGDITITIIKINTRGDAYKKG